MSVPDYRRHDANAASQVQRRPAPRRRSRPANRIHGRRPSLKAVLAVSALVSLALVVGVFIWGALKYSSVATKLAPANIEDLNEVRGVLDADARDAGDPRYILLLGADRRPGQSRARSDTILVVRIDSADDSLSMLSIPRDTRVPVDGHGLDKITHANAYGGPALAVKTVKEYTGLPIHHYLEVDFEGFTRIVNLVGGVTVTVDEPINDVHGSDTGGVSDVTYIPAGQQTLTAEQALTFVRTRAYAEGDFKRIENQQRFLTALMKQTMRGDNISRLPQIAEVAADSVETDMSVRQLLGFAQVLRNLSDGDIRGFTAPGTPGRISGVSYVIPDEEASRRLFEQFRMGTAEQD